MDADKMDKFMREMFSNSPTFNMDTNMDGCDCGDSCDCSGENDCGCGDEHKETKVYGFNMTIGPDGKPIVKEYGNMPSSFDLSSLFNMGPTMNKIPQFGASIPTKKNHIKENHDTVGSYGSNIDFIDNPAEGTGKIVAEMPGVSKDDIKITYRERYMHIQANGDTKEYKESIELPAIDEKSIKATYKNSILEVTFEYDHNIKATSVKVE